MNTTEAPLFTPLLMHDAPLASRTLLEQAHRYFGFVPNLIATMAHSPSALRVYLNAVLGFQRGTLTPGEQQIVLLAASKENACRYCTHRTARSQGSLLTYQACDRRDRE
jgi:alkylhydroperoxidase family enzyme